jgi:asparagine synthetase B (glutamine-hydrolysing)
MKPSADAVKHAGAAYARVLSDGKHTYTVYLDGDGADEVAALEEFLHKGGEKSLRTPKYQSGVALRLHRTPNDNRLPAKKGGA